MVSRAEIGDGSIDASGRELLAELGIDRDELQWRKGFVGFDEDDEARLASLEPFVDENLDALASAFNDSLYGSDRTLEVIERSDRTRVDDRSYLQRVVGGYFKSFVGGTYDLDYYAARTRIGRLHDTVDMPLHFFGGMFANVAGIVFEALNEAATAEATEGLDDEAAAQVDAAFDDAFADAMAATDGGRSSLSNPRPDGGVGARDDGPASGESVYDTPDGLPAGMPDFAKKLLDEETKAKIRRGELDRPDGR